MAEAKRIDLMEAAHRLGVDYYVARRWALTRTLKAERIDGHWYVDADDLERMLRERGEHSRVQV